jgi:hypothetical protein
MILFLDEFQQSKGLDSCKTVQVYFHATGDDILLPNRYIEKVVTFQCIYYSLIT